MTNRRNAKIAAALRRGCLLAALGAAGLAATPAQATEGGASLYLLGSGGPGAGVAPPLEGVYVGKTIYIYDGDINADRQFVIGGNVVAGLDATIVASFDAIQWVPSTNFLGGTLTVGAIVPIGAPMLDVEAVLTGPGGGQATIGRRDSTLTVGDPVGTVALGWKADKLHIQASSMVNFPVGHYREGELANISLHRWIVDGSLAASWHDTESGWDISAKGGVTFNGRNDFTDYDSGNELHLEAAVEKTFSSKFSAGIQGYYYKQITGDSGTGARLGAFKGETAAIGGTVAYNTVLGRAPTSFRLQMFHEFDTTNRLKGNSLMFTIALPLSMKMPTAP